MIKNQLSEDENEGFFQHIPQIITKNQPHLKQLQPISIQQDPNLTIQSKRPIDYHSRVISNFFHLNHYPDLLMQDKCQQQSEQIGNRKVFQKIPQKYLTLQEKYLNNDQFQLVFSKIHHQQFNNYIFSLDFLTDYNQNHYVSESSPTQNSLNIAKMQQETSQLQKNSISFKFDSHFQCGNLLYAFQDMREKQIPTFNLIIQNDTNTKGYNQWFYFSIQKIASNLPFNTQISSNKQERRTIRIRIVNFIKKHLMFEDGVRPVGMFQNEGQWKFIGRDVQYKKSYIKRNIQFNGSNVTKNFYTLSFLLDFPQIQKQRTQKLYIALNYPYPYKRAISFIDNFIACNKPQAITIQKKTLCHTISNNQVPYLIISSKPSKKQIQVNFKVNKIKKQKQKQKINNQIQNDPKETQAQNVLKQIPQVQNQQSEKLISQQILAKRKKIILFARQHPGQTVGSFVLQGFLKQLMREIEQKKTLPKAENQNQNKLSEQKPNQGSQLDYKLLRQYTIYVFPMINVDGVIYGNFRTNLAGFDLNRQWIEPSKWLHPQIYYLKKFISSLNNVQFFLDFHGHSRKLNSFIYACNNPVPILLQNQDQNDYPNISMFRLYPFIFSKQTDLFSIKDCTYTISKDKIKTARINTFKNLKFNPYIFTLETGFYGYTKEDKKFRFKIDDFYIIGKAAFQSLKTVLLKPKKVKQVLKDVQNKSYLFDMWAYQNKQDPGSESNPSQDELNPIEFRTKVLAEQRLKERERRRNQLIKRTQNLKNKTQRKRQRIKKIQRKIQTELKSQRKIQQFDQTDIKLTIQRKEVQKEVKIRKEIRSQNHKGRSIKVEYYPDKKRNVNSELFNVVTMKEAVLEKPEFFLPHSNNRQKGNRVDRKGHHQDFKTTSNLLGAGLSYYQNKAYGLLEPVVKSNPPTLQMLQINNIKRDIRIQSSVDVSSYEDTRIRKRENPTERQNKMKDLFFSLHRQEDKNKFTKQTKGQKIFVVRQNKIVKVVNNVNKFKSQSTILQGDLSFRQNKLKICQEKMSQEDKTLIEEIKDQRFDEKLRKKKVLLNPIQY